MMLHVINKSKLLKQCLSLKSPDDIVLLIEEAVTLANTLEMSPKLFVLEEDFVKINKTNHVPSHINLVNYAGFVELVINHSPVQSWY